MTYSVEYENDTGPDDEGFWEWWNVRRGDRLIAKAETEEWAKALVFLLENAADNSALAAAIDADAKSARRTW